MNKVVKIISSISKMESKNKSILNNVVNAFAIKGAALVVSLFTLPAYMGYFDNHVILGMWFTILSVLSWILNFDFGIGNGLRNKLVKPMVSNDVISMKKYISSAYFMIGFVVILVLATSSVVFPFINWNKVFNISIGLVSKDILLKTVYIIFFGLMLQFFLRLISSIFYAMQISYMPNLFNLLSTTITLIFVLISKSGSIEENLIRLACIQLLAINIPLLIATIFLFLTKLKHCIPSIKTFNLKYGIEVVKLGGVFFWIQIMFMLLVNTNEFLISWFTNPGDVVEYQIYQKLFTLLGVIFTLALTPVWSAVTKAMAENDFIWINKLYKIIKRVAIIVIISEFFIILFLQVFINLWLGENAIEIKYNFAIVFALSGSLLIWNGAISSIANGTGELKVQAIFLTIGVIIKLVASYYLVQINDAWISIIIANVLAFLPYCIIQSIAINRYLKVKVEG